MVIIPTILCGGAGSRLWPISRSMHPKPFIRLNDGQSLLQKAFLRGNSQNDVNEILTVTNRELLFKTEDDYREVNNEATPVTFIMEPFGKNTAAAIALSVLHVIESHGEDALLLVLPADHLISDELAFSSAVNLAKKLAATDKLVTFGIQPTTPETGYGYIHAEGTEVKSFEEKPDLQTAQNYLQSGNYLWNAGMFCFKAGVMLAEMKLYCPDILSAVAQCMENSRKATGTGYKQLELDAETFGAVREDSIDFAVFEKSNKIAVVPCDVGWSDIGSWSAMAQLILADENGNRIDGSAQLFDT